MSGTYATATKVVGISIGDILVTGGAARVASRISDQTAGSIIVTATGRPVGIGVAAEASVAEIVPVEVVVIAPVGVTVPVGVIAVPVRVTATQVCVTAIPVGVTVVLDAAARAQPHVQVVEVTDEHSEVVLERVQAVEAVVNVVEVSVEVVDIVVPVVVATTDEVAVTPSAAGIITIVALIARSTKTSGRGEIPR